MRYFTARERGKNARHQGAGGIGAQFDRHAVASALAFVGEIDGENVVKRRIIRMIEIDIGGVDPHPPFTAFSAADESGLFHDIAAHDDNPRLLSARLLGGDARRRAGQIAREKSKNLFPPIQRLFRTIGAAPGVKEGVPGAIVAMEFVILAKTFEHGLGPVHLSAVGLASSLPKMPNSGQFSFSVRSIGATGRLSLRSFG